MRLTALLLVAPWDHRARTADPRRQRGLRFLVDNALSPAVAAALSEAGHDALHVRDIGMQAAADVQSFDRAAADQRVVVSADTDFAARPAERASSEPSVILFRHGEERSPQPQAALLPANVPALEVALKVGSGAVIEPGRIRIRRLPLG